MDYRLLSVDVGRNVAVLEDGSAVCWGDTTGKRIPDTGGRAFVQVSAGTWHTVAILDDGSCVGWGRNYNGVCDIPDTQGRKFMIPSSGNTKIRTKMLMCFQNVVKWEN